MSEQIDKSTQEWLKEIMVAESPYAELKKRITELERENQALKEGKARVEQMLRQALDNNYELRNDNYQLRPRVEELERQLQGYKEENVKLLQTLLALHRAVKRANAELDKIGESCDNNVWFQRLKERTY